MLILVINPVTVFLNGDYDNELRAIIANENSNIQDILQQDNTYVKQKDDMILALAIKKYIYSELKIDCDVTVSGSYGVSGTAGEKMGGPSGGKTWSSASDKTESVTSDKNGKIAGNNVEEASGSTQVYITIKEFSLTSQGSVNENSGNTKSKKINSEKTNSKNEVNDTVQASDNNELVEKQVISIVCNGFGIDEANISVKFKIK